MMSRAPGFLTASGKLVLQRLLVPISVTARFLKTQPVPPEWFELHDRLDCNDVSFDDFVNVDVNVIVAD